MNTGADCGQKRSRTHHERGSPPNPGRRQLSRWVFCDNADRSPAQAYFHDKMGNTSVYEHLQTLRRRYKVKRREVPPALPTCSGAFWSVGCFGCAKSRLSSVIIQKQMCAKLRTLPYAYSNIAARYNH